MEKNVAPPADSGRENVTKDLLPRGGDSDKVDQKNRPANTIPGESEGAESEINLDFDRRRRCGFPEAIYGEGKSIEQLCEIVTQQLQSGERILITRVTDPIASELGNRFELSHNSVARTVTIFPVSIEGNETKLTKEQREMEPRHPVGYVPVLTAGTTDLPVAEEALETLRWMNIGTRKIMDIGVAGPHRLVEKLDALQNADAIVVIAGMEGALPSVVAGHVDCPVIAVPTSVGYGANLGGIAALLSMLNSCAANVSVVNIDAGFKGAFVAGLVASRAQRRKK